MNNQLDRISQGNSFLAAETKIGFADVTCRPLQGAEFRRCSSIGHWLHHRPVVSQQAVLAMDERNDCVAALDELSAKFAADKPRSSGHENTAARSRHSCLQHFRAWKFRYHRVMPVVRRWPYRASVRDLMQQGG